MGGALSAIKKTTRKTGHAMDNFGNVIPEYSGLGTLAKETLKKTDALITNLDGISGRCITTIEEAGKNVSSMGASALNVAKFGVRATVLKNLFDSGVSTYQTVKLIRIARDAGNDLKNLVDNTSKTEDEIVNVLRNAGGDLRSGTHLFSSDVHKMGQDFGHMTGSLSQSSAEISGAVDKASRNFGYMTNAASEFLAYTSQDIHQTNRYFRVTCISLTTSALAAATAALVASMTYLQNSSCDRDRESMLCAAPLKSMAVVTIVTGFVAIRMLMPNRVQYQMHQNSKILIPNETTNIDHPDQFQLNERTGHKFFIPEEGIDQNVEWTEDQLDSIKAINFDVFKVIEAKRKLECCKWTKQELEWLLNQDENIFFDVIVSGLT